MNCIPLCSRSASVTVPKRTSSSKSSIELEPGDCNLAALGRTIKILLLTADESFSLVVRSYLRHIGFTVFTCSSSDRAEKLFLERRDIDLWLIDTHSLEMEGLYFATKVRALHPMVPLILIVSSIRKKETDIQKLFWENWIRISRPVALPCLLEHIQKCLYGSSNLPATSTAGSGSCSQSGPDVTPWTDMLPQNRLLN